MTKMQIADPVTDPLFWLSSAFILYFSAILFIFFFFEPVAKIDEVAAVTIYIFHNVFHIMKNTLIAIAFYTASRKITAQII